MPKAPTTTSLDPANQTAMIHSLAQVKTAAGARNFCAVLWEYLANNYHTQADFNTFVTGLLNYSFGNIVVNQVQIGNNLRIRATSNGGVLELLGIDGVWRSQLSWNKSKPSGT